MGAAKPDDPSIDRRRGPSRLVQWSRERTLHFWFVWPALVLAVLFLGAGASYLIFRGPLEIKTAMTRSNLVGLALALVVPPACVTFIWRRIRSRRHSE